MTKRGGTTEPKYIDGVLHDQDAFRLRIVEVLRAAGEGGASAKDIAKVFGGDWDEAQNLTRLQSTLGNMYRARRVKRLSHGRYTVDEKTFAMLQTSNFASTERAYIDALKALGGVAKLARIGKWLGLDREMGRVVPLDERNYPYVAMKRVVFRSRHFLQRDGVQGWYYLDEAEMFTIPLAGRALWRMSYWGYQDTVNSTADFNDQAIDFADEALARQGAFYNLVLRVAGVSLVALMKEHPALARQVREWIGAHQEKAQLRKWWMTTRAPDEMELTGLEIDNHIAAALPHLLMQAMERGDPHTHFTCPVAFHWELAAALDGSAPLLSRGVLFRPNPKDQLGVAAQG